MSGASGSARDGAMKRGFGSHGSGVYVNAKHEGVISVQATFVPSDRPAFVVSAMSRSVYSTTARSGSAGSTMMSPPSPPKGDTIRSAPAGRYETPLSCSPPQYASPSAV